MKFGLVDLRSRNLSGSTLTSYQGFRTITVTYPTHCAVCGDRVESGHTAHWNGTTKQMVHCGCWHEAPINRMEIWTADIPVLDEDDNITGRRIANIVITTLRRETAAPKNVRLLTQVGTAETGMTIRQIKAAFQVVRTYT